MDSSGLIETRERNPFAEVLGFVVPLIATSVLQLLFNTADTVVVGRWGGDTKAECEAALAAVGSCGSLINLIICFFMGLSLGASVYAAQRYGAKDADGVSRALHTAIPTSFLFGLAVTAVGEIFARDFLILMDTDAAALDQATLYMRAYFIGVPASILYNYCAAIVRSVGDTTRPLICLTTGGVVNVILNLIMVIGFRLGALGVGLATAASQWIACLILLFFLSRDKGCLHLSPKKLRIDPMVFRIMLRIGVPAGIQSIIFAYSNVLIQASVNSFGSTTVVAGNTAAANIGDYVYTSQNAYYHAVLTFVGQAYGAKRIDKMKKYIGSCVLLVCLTGLTVGAAVNLLAHPLLNIYVPGNEAAIAVGITRLRWIALPYFLCGLMEVGCGILRGFGKSMLTMFISIIGCCVIRVGWILLILPLFDPAIKLQMLYFSYAFSWIVTSAAYYAMLPSALRKQKAAWA